MLICKSAFHNLHWSKLFRMIGFHFRGTAYQLGSNISFEFYDNFKFLDAMFYLKIFKLLSDIYSVSATYLFYIKWKDLEIVIFLLKLNQYDRRNYSLMGNNM